METLIRELSEETAKVRFYKVDVDAQQEISKFVGGVHIMPTIFVYKSGQTVNTMAGANPKGLRVCPNHSSHSFSRSSHSA
jgi:thioredoxin-like negative regulator of GroEL